MLLDCGTLHELKGRDLQKVRWLFLSHLHIDHLIGFDHLLRLRLFSELPLTVYGPPGTLRILAHRLQGYAWNLTSGSPFVVRVRELQGGAAGAEFPCHHSFQARPLPASAEDEAPSVEGVVALGAGISVRSWPVRHGVPCLAFRLDRATLPKFCLEKARRLGLFPGPWVGQLVGGQPTSQVGDGVARDQDWLARELLGPPLRHSLGYLTDTLLEEPLTEQLVEFFRGVDVLCSETAYLRDEAGLARQNLHMTTSGVASLARRCGAAELRIFHLSRRHCESGSGKHLDEVRQVFAASSLLWESAGKSAENSSRAASESPS
jgi:ribonuclease Z